MNAIDRSKRSKIASNASSILGPSKLSVNTNVKPKLRSELRRVMSDRVLKITKCSQQQKKLQQQQQQQQSQPIDKTKDAVKRPLLDASILNSNSLPNMMTKNPSQPSVLIQPLPPPPPPADSRPQIDLQDKTILIKHIKDIYNECLKYPETTISTAQSIIKSIKEYISTNKIDLKHTVNQILKENLFQSNLQLKQKYKADEQNESLKTEGLLQILLQIENYIIAHITSKSKHVDDDWIWEIANLIRWMSQTFREKFKIEKFLFTDIYGTYHHVNPDFVTGLMEELGYDKDDGDESSNQALSEKTDTSTRSSPLATPLAHTPVKSSPSKKNITVSKFGKHLINEDSNCTLTITPISGGINSLFEDAVEFCSQSNANNPNNISNTSNNENDTSNHNVSNENNDDDILNDLKKKKLVNRFTDYSVGSMRSIVVQQKKRMRLKIRSPYKSPSKSFLASNGLSTSTKRTISISESNPRRSPRIKDKPSDESNSNSNRKRPRTYLITDTPDHKQNSTIITTRQEKVKKRFSFQQFNSLPVVPDTPVKNENNKNHNSSDLISDNIPPQISARCSEVILTTMTTTTTTTTRRLYASPAKKASCSSYFD